MFSDSPSRMTSSDVLTVSEIAEVTSEVLT
jgi:hypothetical protein